MDWEILYYSDEVQEAIDAWPVDIRAYYTLILHAYIKKSQKTPARELEPPASAWPRYKDGVKNGSDEDTR